MVYFASCRHHAQARIPAKSIFAGLSIAIPLSMDSVSIEAKAQVAAVMFCYSETTPTLSQSPWTNEKLGLINSSAAGIAHEADLTVGFFFIVLLEFIYRVIIDDPTSIYLTLRYAKAAATLVITFLTYSVYATGDGYF